MSDDTLTRTLLHRIDELEMDVLVYRDRIRELEAELTEYKKAELLAVGFGEDGVVGCK